MSSASRDHATATGIALEKARETVRRALEAADNANHAGEMAVLAMAEALNPVPDIGDVAADAFDKMVGTVGAFDAAEWYTQDHYINFAAFVLSAYSRPAVIDVANSRDEQQNPPTNRGSEP